MPFITLAQARAASRSSGNVAESQLRKSAAVSMNTFFDIFMSHSYEDAEVIAGVKNLIEREGLSVYVDWIHDTQADRSKVTTSTAAMLRERMRHCGFLIYASSKTSPNSRWMPWELGYFDGLRNGNVGILPIVQWEGESFIGQEYLGLYPSYEQINFAEIGKCFGTFTGPNMGERLKIAARSRS